MGTKLGLTVEERFWMKVDKRGPDECWNWTGSTGGNGYGKILGTGGASGKLIVASRLSYEIHKGNIPDGYCVCHRCDNRGCVNPAHLFLATSKENSRDMVLKHREYHPAGEKHRQHKLTDAIVIEIRAAYDAGTLNISETAKRLGVCYNGVWHVAKRKRWTHI